MREMREFDGVGVYIVVVRRHSPNSIAKPRTPYCIIKRLLHVRIHPIQVIPIPPSRIPAL